MSRPERELHFRSGMCEDSILYVPYGEINKQWNQLNEYCDHLEHLSSFHLKRQKEEIRNNMKLLNQLEIYNKALNLACNALAGYEIIVNEGTTYFCANNAEAYYKFLMKENKNE